MKKRIVNKYVFNINMLIFYSFCLIGLIWQISQISINFFKFDVFKDINIVTPEETDRTEEMFTICFDNSEILIDADYIKVMESTYKHVKKYQTIITRKNYKGIYVKRVMVNMMKIGERFDITYVPEDIATYHHEFILGRSYCFQAHIRERYRYEYDMIENVTTIQISVSKKSFFDIRRLQIIADVNTTNMGLNIFTKSYSYTMNRLQWPYTDNCSDYHYIGYRNMIDAITNCSNSIAMFTYGKVHPKRAIDVRIDKYFNYTVYSDTESEVYDHCTLKYRNLECNSVSHYTTFERGLNPISKAMMVVVSIDSPSFIIESKPRINHIDYITYVFGALGTWIGFSFIHINPCQHFIEHKQSELKPDKEYASRQDIIDIRNRISIDKAVVHSILSKLSAVQIELSAIKNRIE